MPAWRPNAGWLRPAVESALEQTHSNVELIVVDDGSQEPVAGLLRAVRNERLRIVRTEHGGASSARNAGIAAASGQWIRFIDCDDVLPPGSTSALLDAAGDAWAIVHGATVLCDRDLKPVGRLASRLEGDVRLACLLGRLDISLPAVLFRRDIVEAVGGFDTSLEVMEDFDFVLRALAEAPIGRVDEAVYLYRRHSASSTGEVSLERSERCWRYVAERFFERHPELAGADLRRRVEAVIHLDGARACFGGRKYGAMLGRLAKAARCSPASVARLVGAAAVRRLTP
jgi:glycosyltransferase involved in cell wall biosynthesis